MQSQASKLICELFSPRTILRGEGQAEIEEALVGLGACAVPELIEVLRSWRAGGVYGFLLSQEPAQHAITALGRIGDPRAIEVLVELLWRGGNRLAPAALEALTSLGNRQAVPLVVARMLPDGRHDLTSGDCFGAQLLARLAGERDLDALCEALEMLAGDQVLSERHLKTTALKELVARIESSKDPRAIFPLLSLASADYVTVGALVRFGPKAIPDLIRALDVHAPRVDADKALLALIGLGPDVMPELRVLVPGPSSARTSRCAVALCRLGVRERELIPPIIEAIDGGWSRPLALEALAELAEQFTDPILLPAVPILRRVARNWQLASKVGLVHPMLPTCLEVLARIERDTEALKALPVVSSVGPSSGADLPVVSQPPEC